MTKKTQNKPKSSFTDYNEDPSNPIDAILLYFDTLKKWDNSLKISEGAPPRQDLNYLLRTRSLSRPDTLVQYVKNRSDLKLTKDEFMEAINYSSTGDTSIDSLQEKVDMLYEQKDIFELLQNSPAASVDMSEAQRKHMLQAFRDSNLTGQIRDAEQSVSYAKLLASRQTKCRQLYDAYEKLKAFEAQIEKQGRVLPILFNIGNKNTRLYFPFKEEEISEEDFSVLQREVSQKFSPPTPNKRKKPCRYKNLYVKTPQHPADAIWRFCNPTPGSLFIRGISYVRPLIVGSSRM